MKRLLHLLSKIKFGLLIFLVFVSGEFALAAACCGGGTAVPAVITGDDRAQFSLSTSVTQVVIDNVDRDGIWRTASNSQRVGTLRIEGAQLLSDRVQMGFSVPVLKRTLMSDSYTGLGDVSTSLGYEYLTDWDYNPWRPRAVGYAQLILPTGLSRAESERGGLDSRGNGFWSMGLGTVLTKTFSVWDLYLSAELHRSLVKSVSRSGFTGSVHPGWGGTFGLGAGYNTAKWRFGGAIQWFYEDPIEWQGSLQTRGSIERYATGSLSMSYLYSEEWGVTLSYSDQTLFGDPINTSLGKSLAFLIQMKWAR